MQTRGTPAVRSGLPAMALKAMAAAAALALIVVTGASVREADKARRQLEAVLAGVPEGVTARRVDGTYLYANDPAARLMGFHSAAEVRNITAKDLQGRVEHFSESGERIPFDRLPVSRAVETLAPQDLLFKVRNRRTGEEHWVMQKARPVLNNRGELDLVIVVTEDMTALKELERSKDEFLSAAAHDLRTPLTMVKGLTQVVSRRLRQLPDVPPELLEQLHGIETATYKMNALIDEFLDLTRHGMGETLDLHREKVDLLALIRRVAATHQAATPKHVLKVEPAAAVEGLWDEARIERVLDNIIGNAIKYSPSGGDVTIRLACDETAKQAVVTISDQGIGIPAAEQTHLFERFHRGSNVVGRIAGTGVGLRYSQAVVAAHQGTLTLESQEGSGATATIRLPLDGNSIVSGACTG